VLRIWKEDLPDTLALVPSKKKTGMNPFHPASVLIPRLRKKWGDKSILNIKKISDKKQSGENYENRFFHAKTSFLVQKNDRMIAGRHIMLIDDISTTGASLNELACELLRLGAKKVSCLVLLLSEGYT
jgi:predicted amidophosphoribosyltransferase